jgi:hypothetical protein
MLPGNGRWSRPAPLGSEQPISALDWCREWELGNGRLPRPEPEIKNPDINQIQPRQGAGDAGRLDSGMLIAGGANRRRPISPLGPAAACVTVGPCSNFKVLPFRRG